jgi:hypothetical protein
VLLIVAVMDELDVTVTVGVSVHPLASVTISVYVPGQRAVADAEVCAGVVFHVYV